MKYRKIIRILKDFFQHGFNRTLSIIDQPGNESIYTRHTQPTLSSNLTFILSELLIEFFFSTVGKFSFMPLIEYQNIKIIFQISSDPPRSYKKSIKLFFRSLWKIRDSILNHANFFMLKCFFYLILTYSYIFSIT